MAKFREQIVSNCEKDFVQRCLKEYYRVDERAFDEFRELKIQFGTDWGSCHVNLGETQVLAQVSCEVQVPNTTRPSEGLLYVHIELNPLAAPHYEVGKLTDESVQLNRLLEKCIKDSKAVDLESLCIKVGEKVWAFRVDVNVLNDEGNIIDCASIAALAALAHFRRPDVTCDGEEVIIHTYAERDSIPTVIHHYPVCVSYAVFSNGDIVIADPTLLEEQVSEAQLTIGLNSFKELCGFHLAGSARMSPESILNVTKRATARASKVTRLIKEMLTEDTEKRANGETVEYARSYLFEDSIEGNAENLSAYLDVWTTASARKRHLRKQHGQTDEGNQNEQEEEEEKDDEPQSEVIQPAVVEQISNQSAALIPPNIGHKWEMHSDEEEEAVPPKTIKIEAKSPKKETVKMEVESDGSEEETTIVLNADRMTNKNKGKRRK